MNSTSRSTSSPSEKDPIKAIHDPFGYGYEGRIGVDRETSTRRKGITAVLNRFVTRGIKAPEAAQYDYLITHGFYTVEELKKHPGCPAAQEVKTQKLPDSEDEERADAALAEYTKKVDEEKYLRRKKRITRWEVIRRENQQKKPTPRAVSWTFQEPRSESESDEEHAESRERESGPPPEDRTEFRGGFGRGGGRGGSGRGRGGRGRGSGGRRNGAGGYGGDDADYDDDYTWR